MKKTILPLIGCAAFGTALCAQNVQTQVIYQLQQTFNGGALEVNAGDHTLDTNTTSPGLFQSIFGTISGNTISKAGFTNAVSVAYLENRGGVIDFEDANRSFSGVDYDPPGPATSVARNNAANELVTAGAGSITISRGPNWWFEGSEITPYQGKQTAAFTGTGPSDADRTNYEEVFFFEANSSGSRDEIGTKAMGLTTSYDLDFNIADEISAVGFGVIQYLNFQSQQDVTKNYAFYPNIHAIATFSDGVTTETQMAVALSSDNAGNDVYFGFEGSTGLYLQNLDVYFIGNNDRVFAAIDDFGYVTGPVVVPEPSAYALVGALLAGFVVLFRRRRS